jgi:hypothetical protein
MINWKPTIKTFKKSLILEETKAKESTKKCPRCSNEYLLLQGTLNLKTCTDCGVDIPWYLEENQQPLL